MLLVLCSLTGVVAGSSAVAQTAPPAVVTDELSAPAEALISNSFVLSAGVFVVSTGVHANLNGHTVNEPVDFNHVFGTGSDATRVRVDGLWRITPRNQV